MLVESDGSVRIAWEVEGFDSIHVRARFREREELATFARGVADAALFERTPADLRVALQKTFPGAFDLVVHESADGPARLIVAFHPPVREGRPDET
jgi:hypothetical protein